MRRASLMFAAIAALSLTFAPGLADARAGFGRSSGVTRLHRYSEPLRHPAAPGLSLAGVRLIIPDHVVGLPVLRTLSLCTCCRQYPGTAAGRRLRSSRPAVSAFPERAIGSACTSSFSRLARRSLALRPAHSRRHLYVTCYTEGFSHFVTSMTAPVASGWSVRRVGLAPTGKRRLLTAHARSGSSSRSDYSSGRIEISVRAADAAEAYRLRFSTVTISKPYPSTASARLSLRKANDRLGPGPFAQLSLYLA